MYRIRAQIERLVPDSVRVRTLGEASDIVANLLAYNPDRAVRVTVTDGKGRVVAVRETHPSTFTPSTRRQETGFYR